MSTCLTHTEEYIKLFYLKIGISRPQELQFQTISKQIGITTYYWPEQSQALFTGNQNFILLNENLSSQQKWQDFCHELAHILLHSGYQGRMPPLFREYQENKANSFMYHACIPTFMLNELDIHDVTSKTIWQVQKLFNVEHEFAQKRLIQYISNKHHMSYWNSKYTSLPLQ